MARAFPPLGRHDLSAPRHDGDIRCRAAVKDSRRSATPVIDSVLDVTCVGYRSRRCVRGTVRDLSAEEPVCCSGRQYQFGKDPRLIESARTRLGRSCSFAKRMTYLSTFLTRAMPSAPGRMKMLLRALKTPRAVPS